MAYFPPEKSLQQQRKPSTSHIFGSTQPKRQIYGFQFRPPGTTAVSGEINCLLPPPAGGSGKIGCSIQAVFKVISTPARFGERGARCLVVRLCVLERLVTICSVFWRIDDSGFKNLQEWYGQNIYAVRIAVNRWFNTTRPALNMPCQDKGIPSRMARGYRD